MPARAPTLNRRHATSVREKIKATQIYNKLESHALEKCSCFAPKAGKEAKPCSVADPTGAKISMYLLNQAIGTPPQEIRTEVNVNIKAQVQSIVARVGEERARTALEVLAPGLLTFLPSETVDSKVEA